MSMTNRGREELTRHLLKAIEQVRNDVAKVELWANALDGFSRPVPDYDMGKGRVWLPREQGGDLKRAGTGKRKS